jgi:hypothetical protein
MDTQELIKKANQQFKEKKLDTSLSTIYDETRHYCSWKHNSDDFEVKWNFGLKNISSEMVDIEISSEINIEELLIAEYENTKFKIGGNLVFSELGNFYHIVLFLNEKIVVHAIYNYDMDYREYTFKSLEEFHYSKELEDFLIITSQKIKLFQHQQKQMLKNEILKKNDDKSEGKFTLDK